MARGKGRLRERNKDMLFFVCRAADVVDFKIMFEVSHNNCFFKIDLESEVNRKEFRVHSFIETFEKLKTFFRRCRH